MKEARSILPNNIATLFESRGFEINGSLLKREFNGSCLLDEVVKGRSITHYACALLRQLIREQREKQRLDEIFGERRKGVPWPDDIQ